jgi:hypothetical protein
MKIHCHATQSRIFSLQILEVSFELLDAQFQIIMHVNQFVQPVKSLNDFFFFFFVWTKANALQFLLHALDDVHCETMRLAILL